MIRALVIAVCLLMAACSVNDQIDVHLKSSNFRPDDLRGQSVKIVGEDRVQLVGDDDIYRSLYFRDMDYVRDLMNQFSSQLQNQLQTKVAMGLSNEGLQINFDSLTEESAQKLDSYFKSVSQRYVLVIRSPKVAKIIGQSGIVLLNHGVMSTEQSKTIELSIQIQVWDARSMEKVLELSDSTEANVFLGMWSNAFANARDAMVSQGVNYFVNGPKPKVVF